jgi:aryl-alcohol dehydrogenase-like predicted oxidoreductase
MKNMMVSSKLTMGTAQLGLSYGVSNIVGKPSKISAFQILNTAFKLGIRCFDTARSYGDSESIIGSWHQEKKRTISIITKIPRLEKGLNYVSVEKFIRISIEESLRNLCCNHIWGVMFHSFDTIQEYHSTAVSSLIQLRKEGLVKHIGLSVYNPEELFESLKYEFDLFQAPINCLDARWNTKQLYNALEQKYLFVRSVYLQGLLLLNPNIAEKKVPGSGKYIKKLEEIAQSYKMDRKTISYAFVNSQKQISSLVVGMETIKQAKENAELSQTAYLNEDQIDKIRKEIGQVPVNILNPSLWPKSK